MRSVAIALAVLFLSALSVLGDSSCAHAKSCSASAGAIAALVNQYLQASIGATTADDWLDASGAGAGPGQSLLVPQFSPALPSSGQVMIDEFNNSFPALISANDGRGNSIVNANLYLMQLGITYSGTTSAYDAFCIDLFHTLTLHQTYAVSVADNLDTAFTNGARLPYIIDHYGCEDLSATAIIQPPCKSRCGTWL
jgi:hypothetical protein